MKTLLMVTAAGSLLTTVVMAQTAVAPAPVTQVQTPTASASASSIGQTLKHDLQQAGFTDITMMPDSFLVQVKNKAGEPVVMMIKPKFNDGDR